MTISVESSDEKQLVADPVQLASSVPESKDHQLDQMGMTIADFYANKSVFVTGGTGFLGTVLIEALLSTSPDIGKIYVLVR